MSVPSAAPGRWARLVRGDGVVLGLAPVREGRGRATARVLDPGGAPAGSLTVEVTRRPLDPPRSRLALGAAAVSAGRDACRAERLGQHGTASSSWQASAGQWRAAGDERRGAQAAQRAAGAPPARLSWATSRRAMDPAPAHLTGRPFVVDSFPPA